MPFDRSNCFSAIGMDSANPIIIDIVEALEKQASSCSNTIRNPGPASKKSRCSIPMPWVRPISSS